MTSGDNLVQMSEPIDCSRKHVKPPHHARDVFHAWMAQGAEYAGPLDMPVLAPVYVAPEKLIALSDLKRSSRTHPQAFVHCFEDDDILERFWNRPQRYLGIMRRAQGVVGLDYSVSYDFPTPLKIYNYYRNNLSTYWLQHQGLIVVPQARCEPWNCEEVLAGHPRRSTIAIGARSMVRRIGDRAVLKASVECIVDILEPTNILWYGSNQYGAADYPLSRGVPVSFFPGKGRGQLNHHTSEDR